MEPGAETALASGRTRDSHPSSCEMLLTSSTPSLSEPPVLKLLMNLTPLLISGISGANWSPQTSLYLTPCIQLATGRPLSRPSQLRVSPDKSEGRAGT